MSEFTYNFTSQQGVINLILSTSAIIQTVIFVYHYWKHDRSSKLPHIHEYLEIFAFVFFISAIILTELNVSWNKWMKVDIELHSYYDNIDDDSFMNYLIPWIGVGLFNFRLFIIIFESIGATPPSCACPKLSFSPLSLINLPFLSWIPSDATTTQY